jgi:potassium efflux system protein
MCRTMGIMLGCKRRALILCGVLFWSSWSLQTSLWAQNSVSEPRRPTAQQNELVHPVVMEVALANRQLSEAQQGLAKSVQKAAEKEQILNEKLETLQQSMTSVKERLDKAHGVTHVTRSLLRNERNKLNRQYNAQANRRSIKDRLGLIAKTEFDIYQYDQQSTQLQDIKTAIDTRLSRLSQPVPENQADQTKAQLKALFQSQKTIVQRLSELSLTYSSTLANLDVTERQLVTQINTYQHFIEEQVLWVRTGSISDFAKPAPLWAALQWLVQPSHWQQVGIALWNDLNTQPEFYTIALLGLILTLLARHRVVKHIKALTEKTRHAYTDRFFHTLIVILLTALMSLVWGAAIRFLGWRLELSTVDSEFVRVMAGALTALSFQVFVLIFFYWLLLPDGLALQLGLSDKARAFLRRHLMWFTLVSLPLTLTGTLLQEQQTQEAWAGGLGRLLLMLNQGAFTLLIHLILHPKGPVVSPLLEKHDGDWLERLHPLWRGMAMAIPAGITVLTLFGYAFAASHLYQRLLALALLAVGCRLLFALLIRWLEITQKKSIFRLRLKLRKNALQHPDTDTPFPEEKKAPEQTIQSISDQTRRLIRALVMLTFFLGTWGIFQSTLPAMGIVQDFPLWKTTDAAMTPIDITLGQVISALLVVIMTVVVTRNVPGLLEIALLQNLPLDRGARFAITMLCRYSLAIVGVILAFSRIGIGWSKVQWLVAAMTVGLGFGLQEIFANFVAGVIILFEQPIRVDDVVTVEDVTGMVSKIKIRATTIRRWDRRELIVPNKEFITSRLVNWTLSDNVMRMEFPVGIAYGSDTAKAEKILYDIARSDEQVLTDPAPVVVFKSFGDSCLDFELRVYFNGISTYVPLWHRTNMAIDKAFREANIEIAFPQRDLHIRSSDIPLPVQE